MSDTITFVGTSDGLPSVDRGQSSVLVNLGGKRVLLDAGEPCSRQLLRMGEDVNAIDAVVITHTHSDHVGGLAMLLQTMWLNQRRRKLPLWMPRKAIKPLRAWLDVCYLFDEALPFEIDWQAISVRDVMRIGSVRMRAFRTTHLDYARELVVKGAGGGSTRTFAALQSGLRDNIGFDAFSILVQAGGKRVAYSADMGKPGEIPRLCAKPVDVLIAELAHFGVDELVEALLPLEAKQVAITHMGPRAKQNLRSVRGKLRALHPRRVTLAKDGDVLKI